MSETYAQEVGSLAGALMARLGSVLSVRGTPGPGVVAAHGMLDLDDLGAGKGGQRVVWGGLWGVMGMGSHPRSPRICVQYGLGESV